MKEIKKFAWEKPKTLYRYVNSGDLFCWLCFNKVLILRRVGACTHAFLDFLPILDCLKSLKTRGCKHPPYKIIRCINALFKHSHFVIKSPKIYSDTDESSPKTNWADWQESKLLIC